MFFFLVFIINICPVSSLDCLFGQVGLMLVLHLRRGIWVIYIPVCGAEGFAFNLLPFNCVLLGFFAAFRADSIALQCSMCQKHCHLTSVYQCLPSCRDPWLFVSNTDYSLYPSPQHCENCPEVALCCGGLALSDFLAAFSAAFHFPSAPSSLETFISHISSKCDVAVMMGQFRFRSVIGGRKPPPLTTK